MSELEPIVTEICVDCRMSVEYGTDSIDATDEVRKRIVQAMDDWAEAGYRLVSGEPVGFSWSWCGLCGDRNGGDRFTMTAVSAT